MVTTVLMAVALIVAAGVGRWSRPSMSLPRRCGQP